MGFKCWPHIFRGLFGSFGSAVDVRTRNKLYGVKVLAAYILRLVWCMVKSGPAFCSLALKTNGDRCLQQFNRRFRNCASYWPNYIIELERAHIKMVPMLGNYKFIPLFSA